MKVFALALFGVFVTGYPLVQTEPMLIHGLRPGMLTREIILHAQAKLDTTVWGGSDGHNTIEFKGSYLRDTGNFRVYVIGSDITQVIFISNQRPIKDNTKVYNREMGEIKKLYGPPTEDYHNKFRIVSWESGGLKLNLNTADSGKFYSVSLSNP
jgi:hypothetical protein